MNDVNQTEQSGCLVARRPSTGTETDKPAEQLKDLLSGHGVDALEPPAVAGNRPWKAGSAPAREHLVADPQLVLISGGTQ